MLGSPTDHKATNKKSRMHVLSSGIHPEMDLMQTVLTSWSYVFLVLLKSNVFCAKHSQSTTYAPKSCCFHVRAWAHLCRI